MYSQVSDEMSNMLRMDHTTSELTIYWYNVHENIRLVHGYVLNSVVPVS